MTVSKIGGGMQAYDQIDLSVSRDDDERGIGTKVEIPTIGMM